MSSIAAMASRQAFSRRVFARPSVLRAPPRRFNSSTGSPVSKLEEADLDKGAKRDPELYVRVLPLQLNVFRRGGGEVRGREWLC